MLLTSACGDAVLLRCLSWQVDAMLAVTVRVAVTWPGRDGLSPAVALLGGVAARTSTEQISFPQRGEEICSVEVFAGTPPRRATAGDRPSRPGQVTAPRTVTASIAYTCHQR